MGNSLQHSSDQPTRDQKKAARLHWLLAIAVSALFWLLPLLILLNLQRGLDVSDTGHYYNTLSQFSDIRSMSTQYFLFWDMLPVGEGIYENRLWVFGLFFVAGGVFSLGVAQFLRLSPRTNPKDFAAVAIMWASVYLYYFWWLPDPSYNAVAVILLYALAGLVMGLTTLEQGRKLAVLSLVTGFILAAFTVTRPSSAIVFIGLAAVFYTWFAQPLMSKRTLLVLGAGLAGGLLFMLLAHMFVEPFSATLERQLGGLEMRQVRGRNKNPVLAITRFMSDAGKGITLYWPFVTAIIGGAVLAMLKFTKARRTRLVFMCVSAAGFIGMAAKFSLTFRDGKFPRDTEISTYLLVLVLSLLVIQIARKLWAKSDDRRPWLGAGLWLLVLPYCYVFGTGNLWMKQSLLAGGFLVSAGVVMLIANRKELLFWSTSVLAVLLIVPFGVYTTAQNKPYRLPKPLASQTIPVSIRNGDGGTIRVGKATAKLLNDFSAFYDQFGPADNRAHLIDMSGMSPFLHYHLDAKVMTVPWLIATEKNSQATFEFILARMDAEELRSAWVITAPDNKRHLDGAALRVIGLNFPDDYELVLTTRPPLSKKDIHLYRPKPSSKVITAP